MTDDVEQAISQQFYRDELGAGHLSWQDVKWGLAGGKRTRQLFDLWFDAGAQREGVPLAYQADRKPHQETRI